MKHKDEIQKITNIILKGITIAMGVCVLVLNIMNQIDIKDSIIMLAIGLASIGISSLNNNS